MTFLDTNILSELMHPAPEGAVAWWFGGRLAASVFISATTEADLRCGAIRKAAILAVVIEDRLPP